MKVKTLYQSAVAGGLSLAAGLASAAVDVTDIVTDILAAATPIALIGGAVLTIHYGAKVFKWVRKAG
jgi:hypothetical protein